jgi:hypothetical protein
MKKLLAKLSELKWLAYEKGVPHVLGLFPRSFMAMLICVLHRRFHPKTGKEGSDLVVVMMTGRGLLYQTHAALSSIYYAWSKYPNLVIYGDGSLTPDALEKEYSWWPGAIECKPWQEALTYHSESGHEALVQEIKHGSFLARKLGILLAEAESRPCLWIDTDVLWFAQLPELEQLYHDACLSDQPRVLMCEDLKPRYDQNMVQQATPSLNDPPYRNSGICFLYGNLYECGQVPELLKYPPSASTDPGAREQTIMAYLSHLLEEKLWNLAQVKIPEGDESLKAILQSNCCACHYVSSRRKQLHWHALKLWFRNRVFSQP